MRILAYSPHPMINLSDPAGSTIRTRAMIQAFKQLGHEVDQVIMGDITYDQGGSVVDQGIAQSWRKIKPLVPAYVWESVKDYMLQRYDRQAEAVLDAAVQRQRPDLIYETAHYLQLSGLRVARKFSIPHVYEMNGSFPDERVLLSGKSIYVSNFWPKAYQVEVEQLRQTELVVVVSSRIKETFQARVSLPDEKFLLIPNGIHPEQLHVNEYLREQIRDQYDLNQATVIGFVGSIFPYHGLDLLLDGFAQVIKSEPRQKLHLLIVGGGMILPDLIAHAESLGIASQVTFTGSVPHEEVFTYLDLMDITVLARTEPYMSPIKLFEYGAMKKAVIAPDQPGVRDVMIHEKDGLLIPPKAEAISQAIRRYLKEEAFRNHVSEHFYQKNHSEYTWSHLASRILTTYEGRFSVK